MRPAVPVIWSRWIEAVCLIGGILGLLLALAPEFAGNLLMPAFYDAAFGEGAYANLSEPVKSLQSWLIGLTGAVMVAWLTVIGWIAYIPFRQGESWAWMAIAVSVLVWFLLDGYASVSSGFALNVILNLGFLIAFGLPLAMSYRYFYSSKAGHTGKYTQTEI